MGWQADPNPTQENLQKPEAILEICPSGEEARPAGRPSGEDNHQSRKRQKRPVPNPHPIPQGSVKVPYPLFRACAPACLQSVSAVH